MFNRAKQKLTLYYLGIIMSITIAFSAFVYFNTVKEAQIILQNQQRRIERQYNRMGMMQPNAQIFINQILLENIEEIKNQTILNLILLNTGVLIISGIFGYFLANKTLSPIEEMIKKQKTFISDAAHEIKTPLTALKTDIEVTLRDPKLTVTKAKETLQNSLEEIDELSILTKNLLKQSSYENNTVQEKFEKINLNELIQKSIQKLKPLAKEKNQEFLFVFNKDPIFFNGHKKSLQELFSNLIDNAIKYSTNNTDIKMELEHEKNEIIFKIENEGVEIMQEDLPYIFEPFYRADKSRTNSQKEGYGLGLSIAKKIVENHGGKIYVQSSNHKTIFTVVFLNSLA